MRLFLLFCTIVFIFSACDRRELTYYLEDPTDAGIDVRVDWSQSGLSGEEADYGATVVFFPTDDETEGKVALLGDRNGERVRLKRGHYEVVVFNRSFHDFSGISFRGDSCGNFEAYASRRQAFRGGSAKDEQEYVVLPAEQLASDYEPSFEITQEMIENDKYRTRGKKSVGTTPVLALTPRRLTREIRLTVRVQGLNNVSSATCRLSGVFESVRMADRKLSEHTVTCSFGLSGKVFDSGSTTDGVMTAVINAFGFNPDAIHELDFSARLTDGKTEFNQHFDRVEVVEETGADGYVSLVINIATDKVPDVEPTPDKDDGFGADVDDWGDDEENGIVI